MLSRVQKLAQTRQKNDEKQKFLRRRKQTEPIENTGFSYWTSKTGAPLPGVYAGAPNAWTGGDVFRAGRFATQKGEANAERFPSTTAYSAKRQAILMS